MRDRPGGAPPVVRSSLLRLGRHLSASTLANLRSVLSYLELGRWVDAVVASDGTFAKVATDFDVFSVALRHIDGDRPLYLEFGVFEGRSMRWWSHNLKNASARLVGFDSFEGLPEDWRPGMNRGAFGTGGPPRIDDQRVEFVTGWFDETLPRFSLPQHDQLIVNVDCDVYTSAAFVLRWLEPRLTSGTLVYFDELPDRDHEMRALFEWLERVPGRVRPLATGAGGLHWLFEYVDETGGGG
jgi:hypothetical protein